MFAWSERELNAAQSAAVLDPGSVFLIACPGSGKTKTLTYKIAYELSRKEGSKKILAAITYTNRAADEIHERIESLGVDADQLWIGTIHSFCLDWIIRPYAIYLPELERGFRILDAHEQQQLLEELCQGTGLTYFDCDYYFTEDGYRLGTRDEWKHEKLHRIFAQYFQILYERRQLDFELILYYAAKLVREQPNIPHLLGKIIPLLLIDEYQDTKQIQYSIVSSIIRASAGATRVFIVGDPNQAIYGTLGGYPIGFEEFQAMCSTNLTLRHLVDNYRSSARVINYFSNYNVYQTAINPASHDRDFPSLVSYDGTVASTDLANELIRLIRKSVVEHGISPNQICILAPWWILLASITRQLVAALPEYHFDGPGMIPFSRDQENFWYKFSRIALTEASPVMYVRRMRWAREVILGLSAAGAHIGDLSPKRLLFECNSIQVNETDGLRYLRIFFDAIMSRLSIDSNLYQGLSEQHEAFFGSSQAKIDEFRRRGTEFISDVEFFKKVFRPKTGITVSTIHGVKGAEFDVVIAYGLLEGMVPHFSDQDGVESAKKLLYVASSRARKHLHLISEQGRSRGGRYGAYEATRVLAECVFPYDNA